MKAFFREMIFTSYDLVFIFNYASPQPNSPSDNLVIIFFSNKIIPNMSLVPIIYNTVSLATMAVVVFHLFSRARVIVTPAVYPRFTKFF